MGPSAALAGAQADFVAAAGVSHLATTFAAGSPHVVPVCHALEAGRLVVATDRDTRKVRNLEGDRRAALCVDEYAEDWTRLRQVVVFGEVSIVEGGDAWERGRSLLYRKYPQYPAEAPIEPDTTVILELRIDRITSSGF